MAMDNRSNFFKKISARPLMRKNDLLVIGGVFVLSFALSFLIPQHQTASIVIVEVDGREAYRFSIQKDGEYPIRGCHPVGGTNPVSHTLHIRDGQVYVEDAQCRDKLCEKMGKIDHPGQIIVCVPYKVLIRIEGYQVIENGASPDAVTR